MRGQILVLAGPVLLQKIPLSALHEHGCAEDILRRQLRRERRATLRSVFPRARRRMPLMFFRPASVRTAAPPDVAAVFGPVSARAGRAVLLSQSCRNQG